MNKLIIRGFVLGGACLLTVATMAESSQHEGHKNRFMQFFDTNGDNLVTMDEFKDAALQRFKNMDADNNGSITLEEFQAYIASKRLARRTEYFNKIDTNRDGSISQQEYIDYKLKKADMRFQEMDTNKDGLLSSEEFASRLKDRKGRRHWHGHDGNNPIFSKLDANHDGKITQEESIAAWTRWFNQIDANGDKTVTIDEVRNFRDQVGHNWK